METKKEEPKKTENKYNGKIICSICKKTKGISRNRWNKIEDAEKYKCRECRKREKSE